MLHLCLEENTAFGEGSAPSYCCAEAITCRFNASKEIDFVFYVVAAFTETPPPVQFFIFFLI